MSDAGMISKDFAVRMARMVSKSEREGGKTLNSAGKSDPRRVYGPGWSLGVVVCKGPDDQDDFANNRYWVKQALPTTASGVVAAVAIPDGWIREATNLFEDLGTHLVNPGTPVVVFEGISVEGAACYYLITAADNTGFWAEITGGEEGAWEFEQRLDHGDAWVTPDSPISGTSEDNADLSTARYHVPTGEHVWITPGVKPAVGETPAQRIYSFTYTGLGVAKQGVSGMEVFQTAVTQLSFSRLFSGRADFAFYHDVDAKIGDVIIQWLGIDVVRSDTGGAYSVSGISWADSFFTVSTDANNRALVTLATEGDRKWITMGVNAAGDKLQAAHIGPDDTSLQFCAVASWDGTTLNIGGFHKDGTGHVKASDTSYAGGVSIPKSELKGDKGDTGETGATGATGPTGPTGPAGTGIPTPVPTTGNWVLVCRGGTVAWEEMGTCT